MLRAAVSNLRQIGLYAAIVTGCASWLPAPTPMRTSSNRADPNTQAKCLLVFLPGMGDSATEKPDTAPPIYLASGDQDKLALGHRLLGATLPPERRFRTRGAHDWAPWLILWNDFLDHSDFRARCGEH